MTKKLTLHQLITAAGGTNRVARELGISSGAVSQWIKKGRLPLSDVEKRTNYATRLIDMAGLDVDEWDIRLIGRIR